MHNGAGSPVANSATSAVAAGSLLSGETAGQILAATILLLQIVGNLFLLWVRYRRGDFDRKASNGNGKSKEDRS